LGLKDAFFHKLVQPLVDEMGEAFPELPKAQAIVERSLAQEEARFADTLDNGLKILDNAIAEMADKKFQVKPYSYYMTPMASLST
jgi:alanyl-tRNA synthetase